MREDFARYASLHYLKESGSIRCILSSLRHRGLRTVWHFRLRHLASSGNLLCRLFWSPVIMFCRLILWPSGDCEIAPEVEIGGGLYLAHPLGIVVAPQCSIGRNVSFFSGVVLGINHLDKSRGGPVICSDVILYSGAKVLGLVRIGQAAVVGANSVVTKNVEDHMIVVGVPARPLRGRTEDDLIEF